MESFYFERDPGFSTNCDFKVAKVLANDMIETYVKKELSKLENTELTESGEIDDIFPKVKLTWTASKVDLVALAYGLKHVKSLNYGNVSLIGIARYLGNVFNFDMGEKISRDFYDIKSRKKKDSFFDRMKDSLDDYIDDLDEITMTLSLPAFF